MAEHATIVRLTRFQPAAGKRDELIRRLEEGAAGIRQLEGCFGAPICTVPEGPDAIVAISRRANQAAVDQFLETTATQRADVGNLTAVPPSSQHLISTP